MNKDQNKSEEDKRNLEKRSYLYIPRPFLDFDATLKQVQQKEIKNRQRAKKFIDKRNVTAQERTVDTCHEKSHRNHQIGCAFQNLNACS
jgi:hypothetical protein